MKSELTSIELCAGAGGQALGLHLAGFKHRLLIEIENYACNTLRMNNRMHTLGWEEIIEGDLLEFAKSDLSKYSNIDLVAGGVPCPPFSKAGKQLGRDDERDLFPTALKIIKKTSPKAIMLENVPGLLESKFDDYRKTIDDELQSMGYLTTWQLINAKDFGVPQLRPRVILVGLRKNIFPYFSWPDSYLKAPTVGEALYDLIASDGWVHAEQWREKANKIAPTLVGGSKKHGGPDLGPTRAKKQWQELHINGHRLGDNPPEKFFVGVREGFENMPLLTVRMAARIQGFPDWWEFYGRKTPAYRQVGNALPPPVAKAVGEQIKNAIISASANSE